MVSSIDAVPEPAPQKSSELLLDEPRQRVPLVQARRLGSKRLEVIADHAVQHGPGRPFGAQAESDTIASPY